MPPSPGGLERLQEKGHKVLVQTTSLHYTLMAEHADVDAAGQLVRRTQMAQVWQRLFQDHALQVGTDSAHLLIPGCAIDKQNDIAFPRQGTWLKAVNFQKLSTRVPFRASKRASADMSSALLTRRAHQPISDGSRRRHS